MTNFIQSADSRETSQELMEAILFVAGGDEDRAVSIWEDSGTPEEMRAIWERVTHNGRHQAEDFVWGTAGSAWYDEHKTTTQTNQAWDFYNANRDTPVWQLMDLLNAIDDSPEQDWDRATTTWEFTDGSVISIGGTDVVVGGGES